MSFAISDAGRHRYKPTWRRSKKAARSLFGSLSSRRGFHTSVQRQQRAKDEDEDEDNQDDNPWGDLDKAFENLQDKSLYKQVYVKHPTDPITPSSQASSPSSAVAKDPIAEMEEAIFAQAGAAAVKGPSKPSRNVMMAPLSGVKFSDVPPPAGGSGSMSFGSQGSDGHLSAGEMGGAGVKWSEYMQGNAEDDDSPWSSLDAFADNPESSAQFAVPLHLQEQQNVMQANAQQFHPHHHTPTHQQHSAAEAFAANTAFIQQQSQPDSEEAMFAQAGAEAVARMLHSTSPHPTSSIDTAKLSHIDDSGSASMVDVSPKSTTFRSATAIGRVYMPSTAASLIRTTGDPSGKGPVLHTAQLAGIMAAKRTSDLIPLCHPLPLTHVDVKLSIQDSEEEQESWISVECTAKTAGQTGVEMEALTGCMGACLTVWDMVKAVAGREMRIGEVMVVKKEGGKSGDWVRHE